MSGELGFGIIGVGNIAESHARAVQQVPGVKLRGVFSRSAEKRKEFAVKFDTQAEESLSSLLARKDIDAICVATPSGAHHDVVIPALEADKHILCEKPIEIHLEKIDQMTAKARERKRHLAVVFQSRFGKGAQTLKKAIQDGRFGRLTLCDMYVKWWRSQAYYESGAWRGTWDLDGGGALMNQGIHAVDLLQWLVGMPNEVMSFTSTIAHENIEVEDTAVACLKFPNDFLGVIEAATSVSPGFAKRVEISGDKGSAILEDDRLIYWKFEEETPEDEKIREAAKQTSTIGGGVSDPKAIGLQGHISHVQDLADAIRQNRPPAISGAEARKSVQLVLAIYESAKTGKKILLWK